MKCVLVGGTGFVGSHLAAALSKAAHDVLVTFRNATKLPPQVAGQKISPSTVEEDIAKALVGADVVVILTQPDVAFTQKVISVLRKNPPKRLMHVSSLLVYPNSSTPLTEEVIPEPLTEYEIAKLEEEKLFSNFALESHIPLTVPRLGNVYGPGAKKGIVYWLLEAAVKDAPLTLNGDGTNRRDHVYIDDVVAWLMYSIVKPQKNNFEIINMATSVGTSVKELISLVEIVTNKKIKATFGPAIKEKFSVVGDNKKIVSSSGLAPKTTLKSGLATTFSSLL